MKKFTALVFIFLTALMLSACSTFHDDSTQTYPQDEPYTTTVFLKLKDGVMFKPEMLTNWQGDIERIITESADDTTNPKITAYSVSGSASLYTVNLTLANVPASTMQKSVRPFKIYYTQTMYNPITLMPANEHFIYMVGYTFERRHSSANTEFINQDEDGNYTYLWTTSDPIEVKDIYPNRPLYYAILVAGALVVGVVVYLVSRYIDCKKRKMSL